MSAASLVRTCCVRQCAPGFWPCCCTAPWTHLQPDPPASHTAAEIIAVQASPWQSHLFLPCLLILTPLALKKRWENAGGQQPGLGCHPWAFDIHQGFFLFKNPTNRGKPVTLSAGVPLRRQKGMLLIWIWMLQLVGAAGESPQAFVRANKLV